MREEIHFITLNTHSGYYQIRVRKYDSENSVLQNHAVEPKNVAKFYTAMIQFLRDESTYLLNQIRIIVINTNTTKGIS